MNEQAKPAEVTGKASESTAGLGSFFGYGYAVLEADGNVKKFMADGSQDDVDVIVRVRLGAGGLERYTGKAGRFWAWCRERGLEQRTVRLHAVCSD